MIIGSTKDPSSYYGDEPFTTLGDEGNLRGVLSFL